MSLIRQGGHYLVIGLIQLLLDWAVFVGTSALGVPTMQANVLGRLAGMLLGFWLNGRFTFAVEGERRLGWTRFARFLLAWLVLTLASTYLVGSVDRTLGLQWAWLAKPLVEGGLAVVSFLVMRRFVFR